MFNDDIDSQSHQQLGVILLTVGQNRQKIKNM